VHAVAPDRFAALAADLQAVIVAHLALEVTLGMQVDLFLALAVFYAQFVGAATAR
jgi:hypothetical protein